MEDFVTFEIAKKLKEKGFKEECLLHYTNTGNFLSNSIDTYYRPNQELDYSDFQECFNNGNSIGLVDAPTISQVLKWLREDKNIHIIVEISDSGWYFTVYPQIRWENGILKSDKYIMSFKHKPSYEQAALAGIECAIDNLI